MRTGAILPQLFGLGRWAALPAAFKLQLLRWVIFQALIQNCDAHAKNLSFFWDQRGLQIAPAYDLLSIGIYPGDWFPQTLAMAVGDAFAANDLIPYEWAHMAAKCDLRPRQLASEIVKLAAAIERQAPDVAKQAIAEGGDASVVLRVMNLTIGTSTAQRASAAAIPSIDRMLFAISG